MSEKKISVRFGGQMYDKIQANELKPSDLIRLSVRQFLEYPNCQETIKDLQDESSKWEKKYQDAVEDSVKSEVDHAPYLKHMEQEIMFLRDSNVRFQETVEIDIKQLQDQYNRIMTIIEMSQRLTEKVEESIPEKIEEEKSSWLQTICPPFISRKVRNI